MMEVLLGVVLLGGLGNNNLDVLDDRSDLLEDVSERCNHLMNVLNDRLMDVELKMMRLLDVSMLLKLGAVLLMILLDLNLAGSRIEAENHRGRFGVNVDDVGSMSGIIAGHLDELYLLLSIQHRQEDLLFLGVVEVVVVIVVVVDV